MKIRTYLLLIGIVLFIKPVLAGKNKLLACPDSASYYYGVICKTDELIRVHFVASYTTVSDTFSWNFGDGTTLTGGWGAAQNFLHIYTTPGTYTVTFTITSPGCTPKVKSSVLNIFNSYADLTVNKTSFIYPEPTILSYTTFYSSSATRNYNYKIFLTGGGFVNYDVPLTTSPLTQYWGPGNYTAILRSSEISEAGCVTYDTVHFVVKCSSCTINGIAAVTPVCAGTATQFINNTANCRDEVGPDYTLQYTWDFGDGVVETAFAPNHTYSAPGTYTVKMSYLFPVSEACGYAPFDTSITVVVQNCPPPPCKDCIGSFAPTPGTYIVSTWVKQADGENLLTYDKAAVKITCVTPTTSIVSGTFYPDPGEKIIDGWQRIEQKFTIPGGTTQIKIKLQNTGSSEAYFDDIRIHPVDGTAKSYVYDPLTLRLMAELDENNYATFYEYDEEGILIRVKKETERGIVTLKESRNNNKK